MLEPLPILVWIQGGNTCGAEGKVLWILSTVPPIQETFFVNM